MSTLERAVVIAAEAHVGQADKAGAPYLLHPLRLMLQMKTTDERIVAVLHDVVEDSDWSLEGLRGEGFSEIVVKAVDCVTRRNGEAYEDFVLRSALNPIALRVKLADLKDNCDLSRIPSPTAKDHGRVAKYKDAIVLLEGGHDSGVSYEEAIARHGVALSAPTVMSFGLPEIDRSKLPENDRFSLPEDDRLAVTFTVFVADNFHYQDDSERYTQGEYPTFEAAVTACKRIVDGYLSSARKEGMSATELYNSYVSFGDDPYIVPEPEGERFSSWEYAKERCSEMCS